MSDLKIEQGVPFPGSISARNVKYPWSDMEDGDSFFVSAEEGRPTRWVVAGVGTAGRRWCQRNRPNYMVSIRRVTGGVRVWMLRREDD